MSDRTYGETRNCAGCRFWSEMIAQAIGGGPVQAMCLAESGKYAGKYTVASTRCESWKSGHHGAVDDPPNYGEETRRLYKEEDEAGGPEPLIDDPRIPHGSMVREGDIDLLVDRIADAFTYDETNRHAIVDDDDIPW